MHASLNTGPYRISALKSVSMFQHSKRIRWLQGIVKRWVMKVCIGFMWLMIRYRSGFCKHGKEASSSTTGRKTFRYFRMTQMVQDFNHKEIKYY
jgi:hypothetical protein